MMPDGVAGTRSGSEVSSLMKRGRRLGMGAMYMQ